MNNTHIENFISNTSTSSTPEEIHNKLSVAVNQSDVCDEQLISVQGQVRNKTFFSVVSERKSVGLNKEAKNHEGINALDIALYFLHCVDRDAGDTISPLKLQKLVYYAQAWSLALRSQPLFPEQIQAWVHGPVVYEVWDAYKKYKYGTIPEPDGGLPEFAEDQVEILDEVWNTYGELSAKRLEQLTHSEMPWINARQGLDPGERSQNIITQEDMRFYYSSLMVEDGNKEEASTFT
ncbi:MAG: DUF4065 domain-containing protein [Drouetiella hepatica Uher 2000/2452]|jgi:uncharacterized phage-associated protein|uniref:DUF4065 domain-containing protein n=1 Tax=Drouetiella hepatica Uher 2000/2452 TaxID=904376 RepID=A0A951QFQ7_9CYAN|nr:DUF4065 domain-containing protein [Drouetiella hepatica Uher 2000/2452]